MAIRIFASIILLISVLFLPYWITAIMAFLWIIYFPLYLEGTIIMLLSDLLFGARETKLHDMLFLSFLASLIILILSEIFKRKLKFYS